MEMNILLLVITAIVSSIATLFAMYFYATISIRRQRQQLTKLLDKFKTDNKTNNKSEDEALSTINTKIKFQKVREISEQMLQLQAACNQPSKNAAHSKYKNDIVRQMRELDLKRQKIIKEILDSGHNPEVQILLEDGTTKTRSLKDVLDQLKDVHSASVSNDVKPSKKSHLYLVEDNDELENRDEKILH